MGTMDTGPDSMVNQDLELLRGRARKAQMDDPFAKAAIRAWRTDAIGVGIATNFIHKNPKFVEELKGHWRRWVNHADFDERFDFGGRCGSIFAHTVRDGETIVVRRLGTFKEGIVGLQLQHLPSDYMPVGTYTGYQGVPESHYVVMGVEYRPNGKRAAYHLFERHPNEFVMGRQSGQNKLVRHTAERVLHIQCPETAGESRSVSWLAPSMTRLAQLNDLDDAMLNRAKLASAITGLVKGAPPDDATLPATDGSDDRPVINADLEVGSLLDLAHGEDMTWPEVPDFPSGQDSFTNAQLRAVATGVGRTEWSVSGDYSRVNYSSIRAGNYASNRGTETEQWGWFIPQLNRPVVNWFMQAGSLDGTFSPALRQAYLRAPEEFEFEFTTHGFPFVDPLKESLAAANDVKNGFISRAAVIRSRGENPDEVDAENAADKAREQKLGLVYGDQPVQTRERKTSTRANSHSVQPSLFEDPPPNQLTQ